LGQVPTSARSPWP